jgi:hypothetical protein
MFSATAWWIVCAALASSGAWLAPSSFGPPERGPVSMRAAADSAAPSSRETLAGKPSTSRKKPKPPKSHRGDPPA